MPQTTSLSTFLFILLPFLMSSFAPATFPDDGVTRLLAGIGMALVVVFLVSVLTAVVPPKLIDAKWQLLLASSLVNNASLAVVGGGLVRLALALSPGNGRLRAWTLALRRLSLPLVLLFLLVVPLQVTAAWRYQQGITAGQEQQAMRSGRQLHNLQAAINSSHSAEQIDRKLRQISGGTAGLSPPERRLPLPELKQELLNRAGALFARLQQQVEIQSRSKPDILIKESIRIAVSALAYAFCFAMLAGVSLRGRVIGGLGAPKQNVDEDYFRRLSK